MAGGNNQHVFNPLDKLTLGDNIADALLRFKPIPLKPGPVFKGAGVYAIYYAGREQIYEPISLRNKNGKFKQPIYIGKAIPRGGQKGLIEKNAPQGPDLHGRLAEHADSIRQTKLTLDDFWCRYLLVEDIWIPLGESVLINRFKPLWNVLLTGFGNHAPGGGRGKGKKPVWDVIHSGRPWAKSLKNPKKTKGQLLQEISAFLSDPNEFVRSKGKKNLEKALEAAADNSPDSE